VGFDDADWPGSVTLADDVAAALPGLRAEAERLMVDAVLVQRATGETTIDPVTLAEVPAFVDVYAGPARIQRPGQLSPQDQVAGDFEFNIESILAQLPLSAAGIRYGMRLTVTAVGAISDPDLVGLVATVRANLSKTHAVKRTLVCEVTAP